MDDVDEMVDGDDEEEERVEGRLKNVKGFTAKSFLSCIGC